MPLSSIPYPITILNFFVPLIFLFLFQAFINFAVISFASLLFNTDFVYSYIFFLVNPPHSHPHPSISAETSPCKSETLSGSFFPFIPLILMDFFSSVSSAFLLSTFLFFYRIVFSDKKNRCSADKLESCFLENNQTVQDIRCDFLPPLCPVNIFPKKFYYFFT